MELHSRATHNCVTQEATHRYGAGDGIFLLRRYLSGFRTREATWATDLAGLSVVTLLPTRFPVTSVTLGYPGVVYHHTRSR